MDKKIIVFLLALTCALSGSATTSAMQAADPVQPVVENRAPETSQPAPPRQRGHIPKDDANCTTCDGVRLLDAGRFDRAMHIFQLRAADGDSAAMSNIGWMYQNGLGVPVDVSKALFWYDKSAALGDTASMYQIAWAYQHGAGVPVDYAKAMELYRKAADDGEPVSMNQVGYLYQHGLGVAPNPKTAYCWYMFAIANGYEASAVHVAEIEANAQQPEPGSDACQVLNQP